MLRRLFFGGETSNSPSTNIGLTLLRIFAGIGLITHGVGKLPPGKFVESVANLGFPLPEFFAWAAALSEFAGGILLLLGLLTRPASFFIVCTMLTAAFGRHWNDPFGVKELSLLYLFIALAFMFMGANSWSIDGILRHRNR